MSEENQQVETIAAPIVGHVSYAKGVGDDCKICRNSGKRLKEMHRRFLDQNAGSRISLKAFAKTLFDANSAKIDAKRHSSLMKTAEDQNRILAGEVSYRWQKHKHPISTRPNPAKSKPNLPSLTGGESHSKAQGREKMDRHPVFYTTMPQMFFKKRSWMK